MTWPTIPLPVVPGTAEEQANQPQYYASDWLCDWGSGDVSLDGAGNAQRADGTASLQQRLYARLATQQSAHPIYPRAYGVDMDAALAMPTRSTQLAELQRRIRQELSKESEVRGVQAWQATWHSGDSLTLAFEVLLRAGAPISMQVQVLV
jgi:hypothetical protein